MAGIEVHPRVARRHPEISPEDVLEAWENALMSTPRLSKDPDEYVSIGFDGKGRLLEMVAIRDASGRWLVYHAQTPPTKKTYKEFGIERR